MTNNDALLAQLTNQLYECVLVEEGWREALKTIALVTGSSAANLMVLETQAQVAVMAQTHGVPEEAIATYNAHYYNLDDTVQYAPNLPYGTWYLDRRDMGEHAMRRSAFYQEYMAQYEMSSIACNRLLSFDSEEAYLSLLRSPGQSHLTMEDLDVFKQFLPHVQRAVRLRMHMQRLTRRAGLASIVLDQIHLALLVLDEQGRILLANAKAETLMSNHPQLLPVRSGILQPTGLCLGQFSQWLQSACGRQGAATANGTLLETSQGQPELQLLVLPLPEQLQALNSWDRPLALVVMNQTSQPHGAQHALVRQIYGLTPAEARLAMVLCNGDTPAEASQRLGVSVGTIRVQIQSIFAKTGTNRQADLIRTLSALRLVG